jgi:hypothetical protein
MQVQIECPFWAGSRHPTFSLRISRLMTISEALYAWSIFVRRIFAAR